MADSPTRSVLVIGGGTAGNALSVLLRRAGIAVDLVEVSPDWKASAGSGITLQGNALRVLREVGVLEGVQKDGYAADGVAVLALNGTVLHAHPELRTGGEDLPSHIGMQRPRLQQLLIEKVRAAGADVRLGTTATEFKQDDEGVDVTFSDGTNRRYDLVVGADGLSSTTRSMIGITDKPEPTGMGIWRAPAPRPAGVHRTEMIYGGRCFIAGYCPTGEDTVYVYLAERARDRATLDPDSYADEMRALSEGYGGAWQELRTAFTDPKAVNYAWFDRHLVEGPWHRGRIVLVGDAAHACPPTFAQGAAMSLEDAQVLAELLAGLVDWDAQSLDRLLTDYHARRLPRVRMVVDASVQLGQWLLDGVRDADVPGLMGRTLSALKELP
ncbi:MULTISPECIES: FAD-dependent oxidoreductase [unclassified Streptomyces]|uniref:FAD-dependent oxidoreductase n=1 Tax=unclassified Streptomyces TaxID=2593676 RepID=UPI002E80ACC6|nr:FAD-dependent oxidoreductase [Streptomyces sp. NBC_00589]WTI42036.1 FAD-dependent oxidoreductase [Streptomyces sp. NBC_00775]WUB24281.1 FAD-dependent oxidoreductase [Streptomyces sp. NBC_00589]